MSEVWFRDPLYFIKECAEALVPNIVWNAGLLAKRAIDPQRYHNLHYATAVPYRIMVIYDTYTVELRPSSSPIAPTAVYPTWAYDIHTIADLEDLLQNPAGENKKACSDQRLHPSERPVLGQEHRIVVTRYPDGGTGPGRAFLATLHELQMKYPEAIIHLNGSWTWRIAFGMGFRSSDVDPRQEAINRKLILGSGRLIDYNQAIKHTQWVTLMNMTQGDLDDPSERIIFNIRSANWAAGNFLKTQNFKSRGENVPFDPMDVHHVPAATLTPFTGTPSPITGDKLQCDTCSLTLSCKYYRDGAACGLPKAEPMVTLGDHFRVGGTRDVNTLIEGIGMAMKMEADRIVQAREKEIEEFDEKGLDPELTKAANALVKQGVVVAKIVDPTLAAAGANKTNVLIVNGQQQPTQTPQSLTADIMRALEGEGHLRQDITDDMIMQKMVEMQRRSIEATSRE